jgi:hypothetical protein
MALCDDNQVVQTDVRDKGAQREELLEDITTRIGLQPDHPNVV